MSSLDEILSEIETLDRHVSSLDSTVIATYQKLIVAFKELREDIREIQQVVCLARQPDEESMAKSKTLQDAYKQYEFVKNMVLGNDK